jgi:hypothetical protein
VAFLIVAALTGLTLGVGYWIWTQTPEAAEPETSSPDTPGNFRFKPPDRSWKQDGPTQLGLKVQLAMLHSQPPAGMGIFFHDYETRRPRDAEMIDQAVAKLNGYFKPLEWQPKTDAQPRLADKPALALEFEGEDPHHVQMHGECLLLTWQGYGYWFYTWAPIDRVGEAQIHLDTVRQGFSLLNRREGWKERPPDMETATLDAAPYQLSYVKGLWKKKAKVEGHDPLADLILEGHPPKEARHAGTAANVQVLLLPEASDLPAAVKAARDHYLAFQKSKEGEDYPETTLEPVPDKSGVKMEKDGKVGSLEGHLLKLHVTNAESRERFVVLGIVPIPEHVLVVTCDCDWQRRDYWDQEFTPLLATLRPVKKDR